MTFIIGSNNVNPFTRHFLIIFRWSMLSVCRNVREVATKLPDFAFNAKSYGFKVCVNIIRWYERLDIRYMHINVCICLGWMKWFNVEDFQKFFHVNNNAFSFSYNILRTWVLCFGNIRSLANLLTRRSLPVS